MINKKYFIKTFGCAADVADSEKLAVVLPLKDILRFPVSFRLTKLTITRVVFSADDTQ